MSVPVETADLAARIDRFGPMAFLVTAAGGKPHVVSVSVAVDGEGRLALDAGSTSRANASASGVVTMLWPATPAVESGDYCLIVDGPVTVDDDAERITVTPDRAVLHRMAAATGDLPGCITVPLG